MHKGAVRKVIKSGVFDGNLAKTPTLRTAHALLKKLFKNKRIVCN